MKEITTSEFKSTVSKGDVVIDFWAPWCGPCRMMAPVFDEAAKSHSSVTFAKVNVDEEGQIAQELGIRGIPTVIFFRDGQVVNRVVGAMNKPMLEKTIKETFR